MDDSNKRKRSTNLVLNDILRQAHSIWNRDQEKTRSTGTEDSNFHQFFGCSVLVFQALWSLLLITDTLPEGGSILHLLWTLLFLKTYSKQKVLCSLAGIKDNETFRKWTWLFISAICELQHLVVSFCFCYRTFCTIRIYIPFHIQLSNVNFVILPK